MWHGFQDVYLLQLITIHKPYKNHNTQGIEIIEGQKVIMNNIKACGHAE